MGSQGLRLLVFKGPECNELPLWKRKQESPLISFRPDLILLSGEPAWEVLEGLPVTGEMPMVLDGSNRSWYKKMLSEQREHLYLTDLDGAYMKRW